MTIEKMESLKESYLEKQKQIPAPFLVAVIVSLLGAVLKMWLIVGIGAACCGWCFGAAVWYEYLVRFWTKQQQKEAENIEIK